MFSRSTTSSISHSAFGCEFSFPAVPFEAPPPYSCEFRPLPSRVDSGISAILLCFSLGIEAQDSHPPLHVPTFSGVESTYYVIC